MMKMKLALFTFALGLGSSFAYAAETSGNRCHSWCYTAYDKCLVNGDLVTCMDERDMCLERCGNPP